MTVLWLAASVYGQINQLEVKPFNRQMLPSTINESYSSAALDRDLRNQYEQQHLPGLATCIVKNGEIIWHGCYGYADIDKNLPVSDSTTFVLASVSKTFTGTALMQLWQQGLIDLDADVNIYLPAGVTVINPWHPETAITCRMLLTHTSSIYEKDLYTLVSWGQDSPISLASYIPNYFTPGGSYYDSTNYSKDIPGSSYLYNNRAVALAGYLVELVSGSSFAHYCDEHIFKALNMSNTSWFLNGLDSSNLAVPYTYLNDTHYPYGYYSFPFYPCALLKSSIADLARYLMAYINKGELDGVRILDESTVALMNTVQYPKVAAQMGLVWFLDNQGETPYWYHSGGMYGCHTRISYYPEEKIGIIILINLDHWLVDLQPIYSAMEQYALSYVTETIDPIQSPPVVFNLEQNYPNPFNSITSINYQLAMTNKVELCIYNLRGQKVVTLISGKQPAGIYTIQWDASAFASGVYLYRLQAGTYTQTKKLLLLR